MNSVTYLVPAKINLHLRVAPPDASGFHPLRSWMVTVGLHDVLSGSIADGAPEPVSLTIDDHPTLLADPTNLVHRAALAMRPDRPIALRLRKRIPIGAGLGGGSADAAATLLLVNELLSLRRSRAELHAIAATLGSDVPFFLDAPAAIATGRGERLERCPPPAIARHVLLILPPFGISTPAAYRTLDALRPTAPGSTLSPFDVQGWAKLPARSLLPHLVNDLESPAFQIEPRLAALRSELSESLGRTVRMSGSGSTLFTLYDDAVEAQSAAVAMRARQAIDGVRAVAVSLGSDQIRAFEPTADASETQVGFSD